MGYYSPEYDSRKERYAAYLKSDHWQGLRLKVFSLAGHRCECCGSEHRLVGHHLRYKDLYDCTTEDVLCLCWPCHEKVHTAFRVNNTKPDHYTRAETVELIRRFTEQRSLDLGKPGERLAKIMRAFWKKSKHGHKFSLNIARSMRDELATAITAIETQGKEQGIAKWKENREH